MEWGLWPVHHVFLLFLPPEGEDSSHFYPAPALGLLPWGRPSTSMNFSSLSLIHRVQFFMSCCGVVPMWGHKSFQEPSLSWVSHRFAAFFRHPPPLPWGSPRAAREQPVSPWSPLWACREISAPALRAPPLTPSLTLVAAVLFHLSIVPPSLSAIASKQCFFPTLLSLFSQGLQSLMGLTWPSWSQLALAMLVIGEATGSFLQKPPL